jgi:hypothetical protein
VSACAGLILGSFSCVHAASRIYTLTAFARHRRTRRWTINLLAGTKLLVHGKTYVAHAAFRQSALRIILLDVSVAKHERDEPSWIWSFLRHLDESWFLGQLIEVPVAAVPDETNVGGEGKAPLVIFSPQVHC